LLGLGQRALRGLGLQKAAALFRYIVRPDAEFGFPSFLFLLSTGTHLKGTSYDNLSTAAHSVIKVIREAGGGIELHVGLNAQANRPSLAVNGSAFGERISELCLSPGATTWHSLRSPSGGSFSSLVSRPIQLSASAATSESDVAAAAGSDLSTSSNGKFSRSESCR
jgi:hypothetical protein